MCIAQILRGLGQSPSINVPQIITPWVNDPCAIAL